MPTIRIPTPLRPFTGGATEVAIAGTTVAEAMRDLTAQHPQLQQHLYGSDGELRAFVNIFLDSEDCTYVSGYRRAAALQCAPGKCCCPCSQ